MIYLKYLRFLKGFHKDSHTHTDEPNGLIEWYDGFLYPPSDMLFAFDPRDRNDCLNLWEEWHDYEHNEEED